MYRKENNDYMHLKILSIVTVSNIVAIETIPQDVLQCDGSLISDFLLVAIGIGCPLG